MNVLTTEKRVRVMAALVEGNSIRSTVRMTGVAKNTVTKLLCDVGAACQAFQDESLRGLSCKRIQVDEIWTFCYAKAKNLPAEKRGQLGYGDIWTWTALCADTKLAPCWTVGKRGLKTARVFLADLASRLNDRIQLTSDTWAGYRQAVPEAFGPDVDFAQLHKTYGVRDSGFQNPGRRYSPPVVLRVEPKPHMGNPNPAFISTSFVERQNLTMRMNMRRFTRLTNGFSKKVENLKHAVALHFMYYNFCRIHRSLKTTPAMAAGVADHPWSLEEIVDLLQQSQRQSHQNVRSN